MITTAVLLILGASSPTEQGLGPREGEAVLALRSMREPTPPATEQVVQSLSEKPDNVAFLVDLLIQRKLPALVEGGREQALNVFQEGAILAALEGREASSIRAAIRVALSAEVTANHRRAAILVLGRAVGGPALEDIVAIFAADDGVNAVEDAFVEALATVMKSGPESIEQVKHSWRTFPPHVVPHLVRAIGSAGDHRALHLLGEVMVWRTDLDVLVVSQLPLVGRYVPGFEDSFGDSVSAMLADQRPVAVQTALAALGTVAGMDSVESLIALLDEESRAVSDQALQVLHRVSGMSFPQSAEMWREWFELEQAWLRRHEGQVFEGLTSGHRARQVAGLREAAHHPLFRANWSAAWETLLTSNDEAVRMNTCSVIQRIGAREPVPLLVELLEHESETTRLAAHRALTGVTGWSLAADAALWREAL